MRARIGGILAIILGGLLIATGVTNGGATVGSTPVFCGQLVAGVSPLCPTGHIVITKVLAGDAAPPAGGWTFTINAEDCGFFPGTSDTVHIPATGGTVSSGTLFSSATVGGDLCHYTVTETAVAGWTTTYNPTGELVLGTDTDVAATANDVALTVTNTSASTPTPTVTTTTVAPSSASASPTEALAATGSDHVTPTTIIGAALVVLGGVMLFMGRKPRRA